MPVGSLKAASESILSAWKALARQWETTSNLWNDKVRQRFQKNYMEEYEPLISAALNGLGQLDQVIAQARQNVK
jgi:uncharacterized protein YukE